MSQSLAESIAKNFLGGRLKNVVSSRTLTTPAGGPIEMLSKTGKAGKGVTAEVFFARDNRRRKFAVRIVKRFDYKIDIHLEAQKYKMAPEAFYYLSLTVEKGKDVYNILIMDLIQDTLRNYLSKTPPSSSPKMLCAALECILDKKYLLRFLHGDFHDDNIVILKDGKTLGLIDFDFSILGAPEPYVLMDFIPLINSFATCENKNLGSALVACIENYYLDTFNITIDSRRIKQGKEGGSFYDAGDIILNSYIIQKRYDFPVSAIYKVFPSLKMPKVIP